MRSRLRIALLSAHSAVLLLVFRSSVADWLDLTAHARYYSHLPLVPLISAFLVWRGRGRIFARSVWSVGPSLIPFAGGLVLLAVAEDPRAAQSALTWSLAALILIWLGGFLLIYGPAAVKSGAFPLGMLFFAVPLPETLFSSLVSLLQALSVDTTAALLKLTGVPFMRSDTLFALPGVTIEVARECSGTRSAMTLLVLGALIGRYLLARPVTRAIFLSLLLPITVLQNGLRIVSMLLLGIFVDERVLLEPSIHNLSGTVFFGLTLAGLILPALLLLQWVETRAGRPHTTPAPIAEAPPAA